MRTQNRLSARFVATVAEAGRYADGGNLYLLISPNGGRRWLFMFGWQGKRIEMGLGSAREVTLARAREKAGEARRLLSEGLNPMAAKQEAAAVPLFGEAADRLIASMESSWRNPKHRDQWKMTLAVYAKPLRALRVDQITTEHVLGVLEPVWRLKPETAVRVRGRVEAVLDACKARGERTSENPARWRGHLDKLLPAPKKLSRGHHAAMPYRDVPAFVAKLRATPTTSNFALEFTILCASRSGEVMGSTWGEVDPVDRLWIIPATRMKGKREHRVPLTARALEILEAMRPEKPDSHGLVFPGARGGQLSAMALAMALRRAGGAAYTVHGFRSAFRDWAGDETVHSRELAEAALAHSIRDATEAAYRRASAIEKRRALMRDWEAFLSHEPASNVVPLHKART